jgi:hypothetical protein
MKELPFKPGTSPFRINGVFYLGLRRYIEQRVEGGTDAFTRGLDDPHLAAFVRQTFLATAFYDLLPILPLTDALARLDRTPFNEFVRQRARAQALHDCEGVYRAFIGRRGSEREMLDGVVKTSARIYDFGTIEYVIDRPGVADISRIEVPDPVIGWYQTSTTEYLRAVLEHAAFPNAQVSCYRKEPLHVVQGCRVWKMTFRATWQPLL